MPYELIISEKPNAAKKIADALADGKALKEGPKGVPIYSLTHNGQDVKVVSAVGHLYSVAEKEKSFKYPSYDITWVPTADVDKGAAYSRKYLTAIRKAAKDADSFTVACDYDVEGEVIGLNIVKYACKQKDANRMKFSTLTQEDLQEAYNEKEPHIDWGQAEAGETRHFLDWLYGINLSRALMLAVKAAGSFKVLSSGRVQGPALKIIVDKEREIQAFKPTPFWQLELTADKDGEDVTAMHKEDKFWEQEKAQAVYDKCVGKDATVADVQRKQFKQAPPTPFSLGDLQSESYRVFGIPPKQTLQIAQNLYLAGVTSYPRTSSQKLPAKLGYKKILNALSKQQDYKDHAQTLLNKGSLKPNEGKKTDPAHPAIYPTGVAPKGLTGRDKKVYDLIVKRFFAVFGDAATRETLTVTLDVAEEPFIAKGTLTLKPGWHELYQPYVKLKETQLPQMERGQTLKQKELELQDKETTPPKRYTPSSIVNELEKRNLGTKATRADIVESLYQRGYVAEKSIQATELGTRTIATLEKYCPEIIDEELTKTFEQEMESIRERKHTPDKVLEHARQELDKTLAKFKQHEKEIGQELLEAQRETQDKQAALGPCPKCKDGTLKIMHSKKTRKRFVGCSNYPDCDLTAPLPQSGMVKATDKTCEHDNYPLVSIQMKGKRPANVCLNMDCPGKQSEQELEEAQKEADKGDKTCSKCGKPMKLRKSIYGEFWGCSGYPKCKHTEPINGHGQKKG